MSKNNEKMWAILLHLGMNMWVKQRTELEFDEDIWNYILEECPNAGVNTIILDVGDGVEFGSHPEIATKGAWSRAKLKKELDKCRSLNITVIPKLNFSTVHDRWLGVYHRMVSTPIYYQVCRDLIKEVYELFNQPEYIHLGMDEEYAFMAQNELDFVLYRKEDLLFHDFRFLLDCVKETGAKAWIWSDLFYQTPEKYLEMIDVDECVISPAHYQAIRKENWEPIESNQKCIDYYKKKYPHLKLEYVEEDPFYVDFMEKTPLAVEKGFKIVPCASVCNHFNPYNHNDLLEYAIDNIPDEQMLGFMTAPWEATTHEFKHFFDESFRFFKAAKDKYYKEK